jgi:hypothetical protein
MVREEYGVPGPNAIEGSAEKYWKMLENLREA